MRAPEDHISPHELASLPASPEDLLWGGLEEQTLLQHVQQCEACATLMRTRQELLQIDVVPGSERLCPPETSWLELVAGLRAEDSNSLLAHVAACASCATALREAVQLMQTDSDEEQEMADARASLASSTSAWQKRLAAEFATGAKTKAKSQSRLSLVEWVRGLPRLAALSMAASLVATIALAGFLSWYVVHPSDAHLLAEAYNKQRTLALRIPGGEPVPMASITRSNDSTHGLGEPAALLELHLRAQTNLDRTPNSPYWHQVLGEIELLRGDTIAARRDLEIAQAVDADLPNLLPDLAAVWFELGDSTGSSVDYAQAAELYQRELHSLDDGRSHPTSAAILHYNLALCWERQGLTPLALEELKTSLALERSPRWRTAIQAEIDRVSAHAVIAPAMDDYETALQEVTSTLLPNWSDPQVRARIATMAVLGIHHRDRWLADWAASSHTPQSATADQHLAGAQRAATSGAAEESLNQAKQALQLYRNSHNTAGSLRAAYDKIYAYQRLGRTAECIAGAKQLERTPQLSSYSQLKLRAELDHAICDDRSGDFAGSERLIRSALAQATEDHLSQAELNVRFMQAALLHDMGRLSSAWQANVKGLALCDLVSCAATRRYAFLYDMMRNAQDLGLTYTTAAIMRTAVAVSDQSSNAVTRAYAYETLARVMGQAGDFAAAQKTFTRATELAHADRASMTALYKAEWATDQAAILTKQAKPQEALDLLNGVKTTMLVTDYAPGRIQLFRQLSMAQLQLNRFDEAAASARSAVDEAERAIPNLQGESARQSWAREQEPLYAQLVKAYRAQGDEARALAAWEHFRSMGFAPASHDLDATLRTVGSGTPPGPNESDVLILARVDDRYVGWLAAGQPLQIVRSATLGDRRHLFELATTFYRLCADRDSSLEDVHGVGAKLYAELFQPLIGTMAGATAVARLRLDLDPSLSMLPVAALTAPGGKWFGNSVELTFLPPWWSLMHDGPAGYPVLSSSSPALIVSGFDRTGEEGAEASAVATLFERPFFANADSLDLPSLLHRLGRAAVFHFSGHFSGHPTVPATKQGARELSSPDSPPLLVPEIFGGNGLDRPQLAHMKLAVLAACNTTGADPDHIEELPDLRTAFLMAGTQHVVASNWDVDDRSTSALMLAFYRGFLSGQALTHSLQAAQSSVQSIGLWQHPYYWAGFALFSH